MLTGISADDQQPLSATHLVLSQITVHTVFGAPSRAWTHAVQAFATGVLDPTRIISRTLDLEDAGEALRILAEERERTIKVLLHP